MIGNPYDAALQNALHQPDDRLRPSESDQKFIDAKRAEAEAESRAHQLAWARFAATTDGRAALEAMLDQTLRRGVYSYVPGATMDQTAMHGVFREGQNSLANEIMRMIALGNDMPVPAPL